MKKSIFFLWAMIQSSPVVLAQSAPANSVLYDLPGKKLVFEDYFDNDNHHWLSFDNSSNDSLTQAKIEQGLLQYENRCDSGIYAAGALTDIDFNKDFEIELRSKALSVVRKRRYSGILFWGRDSLNNTTFLYNNEKGYFTLVDCPSGKWDQCKSRERHAPGFARKDFNTITIRHTGRYYYLFLDKKFVGSFLFTPLKGHLIGLGAGQKVTMVYDYIKIYYL